MKAVSQLAFLLLFALCSSVALAQQPGADPNTDFKLPGQGNEGEATPQPEMDPEQRAALFVKPVNDIVERTTLEKKRVLEYDDVREADIMWQKRIWRVLDVREKINLPFANPQRPLITILMEAAEQDKIELYGTLDDKFSTPMTQVQRDAIAGGVDTVPVIDPETYEVSYKLVPRELNPEDVKRFRLQEIWFFDKESSTLKCRILGIAPLKDEYDENGNFLYELPMFWVYYPGAREVLANEYAYAVGNDAANRSWEDVFESRYFNSYIFKESNEHDRRIDGYLTSGRDRLLEADKIKQEIFNFEHDLWSY